jgi:hydroxymethylglutaryl-CoA synthase
MRGIVSFGTYIPYWRLDRAAIANALGTSAGRGARAVASYDEDTTTMGVEAARAALANVPDGLAVDELLFATADPAYLDKTNATAIHAALGLDRSAGAFDMVGAVRSGVGALLTAIRANTPSLLVLSDLRTGLPGSTDESGGGDGAAAFVFGDSDVLATLEGMGSATAEFRDRWRVPGASHSRLWEERFGEAVYGPLADEAFAAALKSAGINAEAVDHLLITGVHARAGRAFARASGVRAEAVVDDLTSAIGNAGTAHPGLLLADVLDRAQPDDVIARAVLSDGVSVSVWRATDALPAWRERRPHGSTVADQIAAGRTDLSYPTFLTWRGQLNREPPRRPDPASPAAPPAYRREDWKFGFTASRCEQCGTRHLPPARVCVNCGAVDTMGEERLADTRATVATFTIDRLAYSLSPPVVAAVVDFDGGGRFRCELTDVDPDTVAIGNRLEMTFRKISTVDGVHNYFWKARPVPADKET